MHEKNLKHSEIMLISYGKHAILAVEKKKKDQEMFCLSSSQFEFDMFGLFVALHFNRWLNCVLQHSTLLQNKMSVLGLCTVL